MDLSQILSIAGKPGLFKLVAHSKNGLIIESLIDGKRINAFMNEKISSLEEISIFTSNEEMALKEVLRNMYTQTNGQKTIDHKSDDKAVKAFFGQAIPDYDQDRVYVSHMRKVIGWYNSLVDKGLIDFIDEDKKNESEESVPE
ncbi:MAG: DUF5606 domain-containing protein [Bacteroidetes bacterium]|nr:DUF5606 domain-containing protein [Bacteroidota bacterium]